MLIVDLPVRGQCQVRVAEIEERTITLLTVAGHPLAGAVRFVVETKAGADRDLRFEIQVFHRAASFVDEMLMRIGGEWLQHAAWTEVAENVATLARGNASPVSVDTTELTGTDAERVAAWASALADQASGNSASGVRS
jgi:NADH dehydrogenase